MPDYLADRFADWMGWSSPTDNRTEFRIPGRREVGGLGSTGMRGKSPRDLLSPASPMRTGLGLSGLNNDAGAYGGTYQRAAIPVPRAGPGPWPGERAAPGGGMAIPGGLPGAAGAPAPPVSTPAAPSAMPQAGYGGQPQTGAMTPAGATPPQRNLLGRAASGVGDLLGGAVRGVGSWMGTPVRNTGVTRGDLIFQALGDVGRGLSLTGNLGQGLALAGEGQRELFKTDRKRLEDEEERQYRRLEMELKRKQLEQEALPKPFGGQDTGYYTMGRDGQPRQVVPPGAGAGDKATNAFQAYWQSIPPEQRTPERAQAWAEEEQARKDAPTPHQQYIEQMGEARYAQAEAAARRAEASGHRAEATQIRLENETRRKEERDRMTAGTGLRKEYDARPEVKKYRAVLPVVRSAIESAGQDDLIADLDLVYAMGTTYDPDSVVREGEQIMIANAQSLPQQLQGQIAQVSGGARLGPDVRRQLLRNLKSRTEGLRKSAEKARTEYAGYARGQQLDPDAFIPGLEDMPPLPDVAGGGGQVDAPPAAEENLPVYETPEAVDEAVRAGILKSGDRFMVPGGKDPRRVP